MVSADNLNFDILGCIFSHLLESDLVSVALVSHSFYDAIVSRLYKKISFGAMHAKRYKKMMTSFNVVISKPELSAYVRVIDIQALPLLRGSPHADFLRDCINCLRLCYNLTSFHCSVNVLPTFIDDLTTMLHLRDVHVNSALTLEQSKIFTSIKGLRSISLDHASWCMMNFFPDWMETLSASLRHLAINMSTDINEMVLEKTLAALPYLQSLRIQSCMKIEHTAVFRYTSLVPQLEDLSVTIWDASQTTSVDHVSLKNLRKLTLDTRITSETSSNKIAWSTILLQTKTSSSPLESLTLKMSQPFAVPDIVINDLITAHATTMTNLKFVNCSISNSSLNNISRSCKKLEKLTIFVPVRDLVPFSDALSHCRCLHTLIDASSESRAVHEYRPSMTANNASYLLQRIPSLVSIVSHNRCWKLTRHENGELRVTLDRIKHRHL